MYSLLIIEESNDLKKSIRDFYSLIAKDEYTFDFSNNLIEGYNKIRKKEYDLVVIDIRLIKQADDEFARKFIERCNYPFILILDANIEDDVIFAHSMSYVSLLPRPFTVSDFYESVGDYFEDRRNEKVNPKLECCGITMNSVTGLVLVDGTPVDISTKAFEVLRVLLENKARVVSRDILLKNVWRDGYQGRERVLDNQIKLLRKQLGIKGSLIRTVKGQGYILGGK